MAGKIWTAAIGLAFVVALPSLMTLLVAASLIGVISPVWKFIDRGTIPEPRLLITFVSMLGIYALCQLAIAAIQRLHFGSECLFANRRRVGRGMIAGGWLLFLFMATTFRGLLSILANWQDGETDKVLYILGFGGWTLLPLIVMLLIDLRMTASKRWARG